MVCLSRKGRVDSLGKAHDEQATTAREPPGAYTLGSPLESVGQSLTRDGRESEDNARPVSATPKVGLRWWNLARGRDGAGRGVSRGEWRPTRPTDGGPTAEDGLGLDDSRAAAHRSGQRRSTSFPLGKASGRPTGTTRPPRSLTALSPRLRAPPTQNKTKQQNQPPKQKTTSPPQPTVAPTKARPYRAISEFPSPPRA